ncbi:MAG: phosphatidate cytidylyltransferase [Chloroflexi bacterium]|nr:phosphatidate cytidylyltransferase [Chloroflexota bacterium]
MLRQRLAVAAVGLPLLALLLAAPEPIFSATVELILAVAAFEFLRAAAPDVDRAAPIAAAAASALYVAVVRINDDVPHHWMLLVVVVLLVGALRPRGVRRGLGDSLAASWLLAVLYPAVLGAHFVLLRNLDDGLRWLLVMLAATFSTDTSAYAVGRLLGRHLMAPRISPKKTWEGAVGGFAFGAAAGAGAPLLLDLDPGVAALVAIAVALPVAAIAGDLLESALKRRLDVKDMSRLLPGHGGLFDRLDSLLLTGPSLYWLLRWLLN